MMMRRLNDCCNWSGVIEVTCFDHDTGRTFAVALDLLRSWQGVSFYGGDHWNIPDSAKLRYQLTLRTPETWYSVHVLVGVLVDSNFAYVLAFDSFTAGTDIQHPCAAIRLPIAALGL